MIALESDDRTLSVGAVRALAMRATASGGAKGHQRLIERFANLSVEAQAALNDVPLRAPLYESLRAMINQRTPRLARRAVEVAVAWQATDVLPAIVDAMLWPDSHEYRSVFAAAVLQLTETLAEAIDYYDSSVTLDNAFPHPADPAFARRAAVNALATALNQYAKHEASEVIDALLLLTPSDEPALIDAICNPNHAAHTPLLFALEMSTSPGAIAVLAAALGDCGAPQALLEVASNRCDEAGLTGILNRLSYPLGARLRDNVTRIESFAWLEPSRYSLLLELTGPAQATAVSLAAASSVSRRRLADVVELLLRDGQPEGRVAACRAIESMPDHVAHAPLSLALESPDPAVVAAAVRLLRRKEYPQATGMLVEMLDHANFGIRTAAQASLSGLSFALFRDQLPQIAPEARPRVGKLIAKADPLASTSLRAELGAGAAERRIRALEMVELTGLVGELVDELIAHMQHDTDTGVRAEAARLLSKAPPLPNVVEALEAAHKDRSPAVRKASGDSLMAIGYAPATLEEAT